MKNVNQDITVEHLKYSRRSQRLINGEVVKISPPSVQRSLVMQNIKSSDTSIERIIEEKLIDLE